MESTHFVYREAESLQELKQLLQLRYRGYRGTKVRQLVAENDHEIDLDCYDLRARHFGLFKNNTQSVGYMRVVENEQRTSGRDDIFRLLKELPSLAMTVNVISQGVFPCMTYFPHVDRLRQLCYKMREGNKMLVEGSRFVLNEAAGALSLTRHVLESAFAIYLFHHSATAIVNCMSQHGRFYTQYGFAPMEGTAVYRFGELDAVCLVGSAHQVPSIFHPRLMQMARAYAKTGQICFNPSNRESFEIPVVGLDGGSFAHSVAA